jgi:hypothetical protein
MKTFEGVIDYRSRECARPEVARLLSNGRTLFCVIGTEYGHLHTTSGEVRVWRSYSGARKALKRYSPL